MFEIGNSLREARLRRRIEFAQAEQATKIRGKYLRALEDEQFDVLPAQTYVKGFLRSYAEYLGLDGQLYVDEYNSRFVVGEEDTTARPRRSAPRPPRGAQVQSRVVLLTLLGIAGVTAIVIVAWTWGEPQKKEPVGLGQTAQTPAVVKPRVTTIPVRLIVTAKRGNWWLEVHSGSATGRILFQGTIGRGETEPFAGQRFWVTVSAPENLVIKVRGKKIHVGGYRPRVIRVTPTTWKAG